MNPFFSTKAQTEKPMIDKSGSTHYSTHSKWSTPKGRNELIEKRATKIIKCDP
ncbi:MAG TPA: hypothetical protein VLE21_04710 [Candidatus Nitrosocosmicus sp.]|nr:hypothetical protein [Candidatus Nitrosocosmicus sp.]